MRYVDVLVWCLIKLGVIGMTKTLAKELGKSQIRCNVILPGFIKVLSLEFHNVIILI